EHDHVQRVAAGQVPPERSGAGQPAEAVGNGRGPAEDGDLVPGLDAELARQRRPGIPGVRCHGYAPSRGSMPEVGGPAYMRDRSVATPSPDRSSSAAARPVIAISREIAGPVTSGPLPVAHSRSLARRPSPAIRRLLPMRRFDVLRKFAARVTASGG